MPDPRFSPLLRHPLVIISAALLLALGIWYLLSGSSQVRTEAPTRNPWTGPVAVSVSPALRGPLQVQVEAIGTVTPLKMATVRSRVEGPLQRILFQEGAMVKQGEVLAQIDPAPYRVKLAQAEGQLLQNQAQLKSAEEDLALYRRLQQEDAIAPQQVDRQVALVEQLRGAIRANEAQVEEARLQLSWTRITAPVDGRLGLRRVDVGNLVRSGDADGIVTLTQTKPISVIFTVPESRLQALRAAFNRGEAALVEARDRSGTEVLATGRLTTLDNQIDTATGTLRLRAEFANEQEELFPNQFVNVRLHLETLDDVITIPGDAVQYGSQGTYVYVVDEDNKARLRLVTLGATDDSRVVVSDGLAAGERVVLEGLDRLRDGREVNIIGADPDAP